MPREAHPCLRLSNLKSDGPHQFQRIALLNDSWAHTVVEDHLTVDHCVFEMDVRGPGCEGMGNLSQCKIVSSDQSDSAPFHQAFDNGFGSHGAVVRIRSMKDFVEKKQNRKVPLRQFHDVVDPLNLRIEP